MYSSAKMQPPPVKTIYLPDARFLAIFGLPTMRLAPLLPLFLIALLGWSGRVMAQEQEKDKPAPATASPAQEPPKRTFNDSLYLKKGQLYIGGSASLITESSKARGSSAYPAQSSIGVVLQPDFGILLTPYSSVGLGLQFLLQNRDDGLPPVYPRGSRLRQKTSRYYLYPNIGLYQAALKRLYVQERLGIGPAVGNVTATLTDSSGRSIEERSFSLRGTELSASVGFLYFLRKEVALNAALQYRIAWEKVTAYNQPVSSLDVWLPTGRYTSQGIRLQVGFTLFIK